MPSLSLSDIYEDLKLVIKAPAAPPLASSSESKDASTGTNDVERRTRSIPETLPETGIVEAFERARELSATDAEKLADASGKLDDVSLAMEDCNKLLDKLQTYLKPS